MIILVPETIGPGWMERRQIRLHAPRRNLLRRQTCRPANTPSMPRTGFAPGLWQNAEFLRDISNLGTGIEVEENGRQQIQLQKMPIEQLEQIAARLGLPVQ